MDFVLIGDFSKPKGDIERLIQKNGGNVVSEIYVRVAAIISTANEVQNMGKLMTNARMHNIQIISEDFLNEIENPDTDFDPLAYILSASICDWGGDVSKQFFYASILIKTSIENKNEN